MAHTQRKIDTPPHGLANNNNPPSWFYRERMGGWQGWRKQFIYHSLGMVVDNLCRMTVF